MAKKMTKKEFIEVFESAGYHFENWGWEGILNIISGYGKYLSEDASRRGLMNMAKKELEVSNTIYEALRDRGYYDDILEKEA